MIIIPVLKLNCQECGKTIETPGKVIGHGRLVPTTFYRSATEDWRYRYGGAVSCSEECRQRIDDGIPLTDRNPWEEIE